MSRSLYVGGLDDSVTLDLLKSAFIPFGPLKDVQLPLDKDGKHRGFAFVEFADSEDSDSAVSNMDGAELFGRTIRVNFSRGAASGKAVWAEAEKWWEGLKGSAAEEEEEEEGAGKGGQGGELPTKQ